MGEQRVRAKLVAWMGMPSGALIDADILLECVNISTSGVITLRLDNELVYVMGRGLIFRVPAGSRRV